MAPLPPVFPNEILDLVIESAAEIFGIRDPYGVKTTPELVKLLKNAALTSHHLCQRAQRHLFHKIRLYPFIGRREGEEGYVPSTWDAFIEIFEENPRLLQYPRSFSITLEYEDRASDLPSHFLSVVLPFLTRNLWLLEHVFLHISWRSSWTWLPCELQDAIVECIKENRLKSITVRHLMLPRQFVHILPSTLRTCTIGVGVKDDPTFSVMFLETTGNRVAPGAVSPTRLRISPMHGNQHPGWVQSQKDTFFRWVSILDLGVKDPQVFNDFMARMPDTLTHLTLLHNNTVHSKSLIHNSSYQCTNSILQG
ncbi:hypothetical protein BKA70DRAFT_1246552 [Coprinopsis sp. MPI-PUGE-AT-0042]|nr:hypothetical protein BKA70DRAFT_1246552 [Coprinopsis sp. MPI-PUGE-AT-0042]